MTQFALQTACECQAILEAELDDQRQVLSGWSRRGGTRVPAPANSIGAEADRFEVVWHCPMCGRNTLRSFHVGALRAIPAPAEDAVEAPPPASDDDDGSDEAAAEG